MMHMKKAYKIAQVGNEWSKWQVEGPECTRSTKLTTQSWFTKDPFGENIFIWGK